MMDQRDKFTSYGLTAEFVGEGQKAERKILKGECQLVFITPEAILHNEKFRNMLLSTTYQEHLVALIVDEAHCIKTWGESFRTAFSRIGDLRSLLPMNVKIMALTATATTETFHVVSNRLGMKSPCLIALPPSRDNIMYHVESKIGGKDLASLLSSEIKEMGRSYPKTILFVRQYSDCSDLYQLIKSKMGDSFTEPPGPGYPDHSKFRVVEMYTSVNTVGKKEQVLETFKSQSGKIRLIIATTTFGMGIDCADISKIIHWGIPSTLEEYVQETGRAGR